MLCRYQHPNSNLQKIGMPELVAPVNQYRVGAAMEGWPRKEMG
jgi:hypothetical protein